MSSDWTTRQLTQLPAWMRENHYLLFGHRPELQSFKECFKSVFRIHTETVDIWTHLIGCVAFIFIAIHFFTSPLCEDCDEDVKPLENLIFSIFFMGAISCLGLSTVYHIVACHSQQVCDLFSQLDYVGIAVQTVGSFVPLLYYGFYFDLPSQVGYISTVCVLGVSAIIATVLLTSPQYRPLRIASFVSLGCFGFIPLLHCICTRGWTQAADEMSLYRILLMAFLYLIGTGLYGARIPERFAPGKFDILLHSHQIFHVCVVAAAYVHYKAIVDMAVYRHTGGS